jgi:NDP-sugar pyrophosphorylase family protein
MNAIIPMAGFGTRFLGENWELPKPLIDVLGMPMLFYSVSSLPLKMFTSIVFVIRKDQNTEILDEALHKSFSGLPYTTLILDGPTNGQAETVYLATESLDQDLPILIHNCDTAFNAFFSQDFFVRNNLLLFKDIYPRWSFARLGSNGEVLETAEKRPISNFASTGTYTFQSSRLYRDVYESFSSDKNDEIYIAPIYNELIKSGVPVGSLFVSDIFCMGTPDDLSNTLHVLSKWQRNEQIFLKSPLI